MSGATAATEIASDDPAVRVIAAAVREAAALPDDSVAFGTLCYLCRVAGYPLDPADARALLRAARGRPRLSVVR